jgi:hypothetical protein
MENAWLKERLEKVQAFRERHARAEMATFFGAGFLFDVATLSRIDDSVTIVQQGAYLLVLCTLVALEQRRHLVGELPGLLGKAMKFSEDGIHFFLGSLMSSFTLFYFKSASGVTSLLFILLVFGALVANELPRFRKLGPVVRFAMLSFCLLSYFAYVIPVLMGSVRPWMFVTAAVLSVGMMGALFELLRRWSPEKGPLLRRAVLPGLSVQVVLVALYFLKVIPPVPLALTFIGIYHGVEQPLRGAPGFVTAGKYRLIHERPWYRFWHNGDQVFHARSGDQIWCFMSIFAPNKFKDRINVHWHRYNEQKGEWVLWEKRPLPLGSGGEMREAGWRTFRSKANYQPGDWKAEITTEDGRTIGSIKFAVLQDTRTEPRVFRMDLR